MNASSFWSISSLLLALLLWLQTAQLHQAQDQVATLQVQQELGWAQKKNLETQYRHDASEKDKETRDAISVARSDADRARAANVRLRNERTNSNNTGGNYAKTAAAPGQCASNGAASMVPTELFYRVDDIAGELAAALDESYARGNGCAGTYDAAVAINWEQ